MSQHIGAIDPGWYPDPKGQPQERYWDGHAWTEQTRPMVITLPKKSTQSDASQETGESD